jgi:hypothetical protein
MVCLTALIVGCLPAFAISLRLQAVKIGNGNSEYNNQAHNHTTILRNESILLDDVEYHALDCPLKVHHKP